MDIKKLAVKSGVIVVEGDDIFWTENDAVEVLTKFAQEIIREVSNANNDK